MIHFDFVVEDGDAENIFDVLNNQISYNREMVARLIEYKKDESVINGYKKDIEYLIGLKAKMVHKRVE